MKYKIDWIEDKSFKGKIKSKASLTDETGKQNTEVQINGNFPNYSQLRPGTTVEGEINTSVFKGRTYYFLNEEKTNTIKNPSAPQWSKGPIDIKAAQERKDEMIKRAQERKDTSIAYFNSVNSSIALVRDNIDLKSEDPNDVKNLISHWRDWFLSEWEKYDAKSDSYKSIPF